MLNILETTSNYKGNIPLLALIAADLIPLAGVVFFGWDAFSIIFIFWFENLVIGFYNILRMIYAKAGKISEKIMTIPFFTIHYGLFCFIHGFFLFHFFGKDDIKLPKSSDEAGVISMIFEVSKDVISFVPEELVFAVLALFISHGISFVFNYIERGEYKIIKVSELMGLPYGRIMIMHFAVLIGAFITTLFGSPVGLLIALVLIKIILNIIFHLREHRKLQKLTHS